MKSEVIVDGIKVPTEVEEFTSKYNIIEVEVGTNGYKGGGMAFGGRTYFRIKDLENTNMRCIIEPKGKKDDVYEATITFSGDSDLHTFLEGLRYAVDTLERQINKRRPEVRLTNEEVGIILQLLQPKIDGPRNKFGMLCRELKEKLERRFEA